MLEKVITIIPAKGNSSRVYRKNTKTVGGKSLVQLAIERSVGSRIGDVFVSTSDESIGRIAGNHPVGVVDRDESLNKDGKEVLDVCLDVINKVGCDYTTMILTLPTSPLSDKDDIIGAYKMFLDNYRKPVMSVSEFQGNPGLTMYKNAKGISYINPDMSLPEILDKYPNRYYRCNGAVYICDIQELIRTKTFISDDLLVYLLSDYNGVDVDTYFDLRIANFLWRERNESL